MAGDLKLNHPWMVAVWPGMGHVAITGGYYLMAKLGMHLLAEFAPDDLFDLEHVEVSDGLIRMGRLPRSRFFVWIDPKEQRDIVVFLGEAQPPSGKYHFCQQLIEYARKLGVERVFTFAAMATDMHPGHDSRVFGAATDLESLAELKRLEMELLKEGHIGGLNGVLLGVAAKSGMRGTCLLGEMPHILAQLPFPKASLAVLKLFTMIAEIDLDLAELRQQSHAVDEELGKLLAQVETDKDEALPADDEEAVAESAGESGPANDDKRRIEELFSQAQTDRRKAFELKQELDRLHLFAEYENRFLDLFKKPDEK